MADALPKKSCLKKKGSFSYESHVSQLVSPDSTKKEVPYLTKISPRATGIKPKYVRTLAPSNRRLSSEYKKTLPKPFSKPKQNISSVLPSKKKEENDTPSRRKSPPRVTIGCKVPLVPGYQQLRLSPDRDSTQSAASAGLVKNSKKENVNRKSRTFAPKMAPIPNQCQMKSSIEPEINPVVGEPKLEYKKTNICSMRKTPQIMLPPKILPCVQNERNSLLSSFTRSTEQNNYLHSNKWINKEKELISKTNICQSKKKTPEISPPPKILPIGVKNVRDPSLSPQAEQNNSFNSNAENNAEKELADKKIPPILLLPKILPSVKNEQNTQPIEDISLNSNLPIKREEDLVESTNNSCKSKENILPILPFPKILPSENEINPLPCPNTEPIHEDNSFNLITTIKKEKEIVDNANNCKHKENTLPISPFPKVSPNENERDQNTEPIKEESSSNSNSPIKREGELLPILILPKILPISMKKEIDPFLSPNTQPIEQANSFNSNTLIKKENLLDYDCPRIKPFHSTNSSETNDNANMGSLIPVHISSIGSNCNSSKIQDRVPSSVPISNRDTGNFSIPVLITSPLGRENILSCPTLLSTDERQKFFSPNVKLIECNNQDTLVQNTPEKTKSSLTADNSVTKKAPDVEAIKMETFHSADSNSVTNKESETNVTAKKIKTSHNADNLVTNKNTETNNIAMKRANSLTADNSVTNNVENNVTTKKMKTSHSADTLATNKDAETNIIATKIENSYTADNLVTNDVENTTKKIITSHNAENLKETTKSAEINVTVKSFTENNCDSSQKMIPSPTISPPPIENAKMSPINPNNSTTDNNGETETAAVEPRAKLSCDDYRYFVLTQYSGQNEPKAHLNSVKAYFEYRKNLRKLERIKNKKSTGATPFKFKAACREPQNLGRGKNKRNAQAEPFKLSAARRNLSFTAHKKPLLPTLSKYYRYKY